jgi:hypothetical protein
MEILGRLFDLYPLESSMILWIREEDGRLRRFEDPFRPRFYAQGKKSDLLDLFHSLQKGQRATGYQWTRKKDLWSGDEVEVMEIEIVDSEHYAQLPRILPQWEEKITFYNLISLCRRPIFMREKFSQQADVLLSLKEIESLKFILIHPSLCG